MQQKSSGLKFEKRLILDFLIIALVVNAGGIVWGIFNGWSVTIGIAIGTLTALIQLCLIMYQTRIVIHVYLTTGSKSKIRFYMLLRALFILVALGFVIVLLRDSVIGFIIGLLTLKFGIYFSEFKQRQ